MNWCEANGVEYIVGLPRNDHLLHKARNIRARAAVEFMATGKTAAVIASVKMVEIRVPAEVAIGQAALGGKVMAWAFSTVGFRSAMASTCM